MWVRKVAFGLLIWALSGQGSDLMGLECERTAYGTGVTLSELTPISELVTSPEKFVDRKVRVSGEVVAVCEAAGCWMVLKAGSGSAQVKIKVEDGVIVFPVSARGKQAEAEGVFARYEMGRSEYEAHARHEAAERGQPFDPRTIGEGPFRIYQLEATGAEICKDRR